MIVRTLSHPTSLHVQLTLQNLALWTPPKRSALLISFAHVFNIYSPFQAVVDPRCHHAAQEEEERQKEEEKWKEIREI